MGILSRLKNVWAAAWGPEDDRWYYPGGPFYGGVFPNQSGFPVDSETAMRLITVHNCVRVRAATIAQLPLHIMEKKGRVRSAAEDFYLYEKLHDQPNSWMTSSEFWGMAEAHVCLRGNFYAFKLGLEGRPIQEIIPLGPDVVQRVRQNQDYSLTYELQLSNGEKKEYPQEKILHLRGLTTNGVVGVNPIEQARETMGLTGASITFLSRYFGKGMHPGAVVKHPLTLNTQAHASLKKSLKEKYAGLGKSWDLMLIDEGMDIQFPQIKLVDAQFLELMKMNEAQICGMFRVPLMLVQSGDKAPTYASAEQFMLAYSIYGVTPDCVNYEKAIRRDLLTPEERRKYYAKFNVNALLRGDFKTRMEGYQIGINSEVLSPNEARGLEDLNPYDGGDEYRTRTSTVRETESQKGAKP